MAEIVLCPRCSEPCRVSDKPSNKRAVPLRFAKTVKSGLCPNCAITAFILSVETLAYGVSKNGTKILLDPNIQKAFGDLFVVGNSDADISEIDWKSVVENWDMPFPDRRGKP